MTVSSLHSTRSRRHNKVTVEGVRRSCRKLGNARQAARRTAKGIWKPGWASLLDEFFVGGIEFRHGVAVDDAHIDPPFEAQDFLFFFGLSWP
jgi:hypothetical protein